MKSTLNQACDYCGLPVRGGVDDGPCYCCSGCRFAAAITGAGGADGQARWMMTCLGLAAFFSMNVMVFTFFLWSEGASSEGNEQAGVLYDLARYASLVFTVPVLLLLGGPLVDSALDDAWRGKISIDSLLVTGVVAAFGISAWATWQGDGHVYFEVACMVLLAVTLGRWLEASGKLQTTAALRDLGALLPDRVRRVRSAFEVATDDVGSATEIPLAEVALGDVLRILPGERVPVDAMIESGHAAMDERTVSGESEPVVRGPGESVRSGTTNLDGVLVIVVAAPPGAGTLEQLIAAVTAAVRTSKLQRTADTIATWFLPAVLAVGMLTCAVQWWFFGLAAGVLSGLAVVVVSCPCALGLATPMALWSAIGRCMRRHILVQDGDALERLADVATFCFDKTGTLTTGCRVDRFEILDGADRDAVLALAARLADGSTHLIAEAIADLVANERMFLAPTVMNVRSVAGAGVEGIDPSTGKTVRLGSPRWIAEHAQAFAESFFGARCVLAIGDEAVAAFWTAEQLRPSAGEAVPGLLELGKSVMILSGDQPARVALVAERLGVSSQSPLLPVQKVRAVETIRAEQGVAMVGDGINDAAALAVADVGIALGCGADVARWTAPICLLDDDLAQVPWLVTLAQETRRTIRWNLLWAFGYNAACIPLAATGLVHPALAAVAMVASSLLVVGNSLRLGRDEASDTLTAPATPRLAIGEAVEAAA